ncbi:TetR/AcrR family transcriptional regulator [Terrabacter lapilli]|uniref:TetR/AcrR family transcriptional regulator n=1 Tax=Terrabacter lapilli TaxID=436231 RepID=A0ABN2RLV3_9MICO
MTTRRPSARERLLTAADRLFYAEGVHAVGIDRLLDEAGVAKGSLFYNFAGKEELVGAYLEGRAAQRRERIAAHQEGLSDPVEKILAIFEALAEAAASPTYNGCPFANANAEATADGVEARALRQFRDWLHEQFRTLTQEAGYADTHVLADQLQVLYDGAVSTSHLDQRAEPVRVAEGIAAQILTSSTRRLDPPFEPQGAAREPMDA